MDRDGESRKNQSSVIIHIFVMGMFITNNVIPEK